jgi:SAM-dependent methyltransferase
MRQAWDQRANSDALFAIESSRRDWTHDEFFEDGRQMVERAIGWLGEEVGRGSMLEVGCGLGRTAVPFASFFEHVDGVDISPRMIEEAVALGLPPNVRLQATSGDDLAPFADRTFDFVFSEHVFQHMADETAIDRYLGEIARVLEPGGFALLQFDTRPRNVASVLIELAPDRLLPRERRRYMRRYRRDAAWIRDRAQAYGLTVAWERGERSHWHWFMLRRPAGSPEASSGSIRAPLREP